MNTVLVGPIVALLGQLVPLIGTNSGLITTVISTLIALIPEVVTEVEALIPPIKNIIAALSANPATTADQMATLQKLDAQCDQAFENAAIDPAADAEGGVA